ncbi:type III secretion apparatus assembly chaperone SctY [Acanthopleuribacter pedis]|uniref:Tetratricopeptide repeat protein n=1 Tax=Acanthopleuribacter pedis TaxID=442870 RepID=A0A8J7U667_9BACT|nr:tetratricopeptide repeat protein [Acanthopleuribacter pedis]MBO1323283.1 tetratricopeptide repeat protein [Acanthopleuribacter pedis]
MDEQQKEFLSLLGFFYLKNGKTEKAGVLFRALLELFPNDAHLQRSLAYTYLVQRKFEQSLLLADRFLDNPGSGPHKAAAFLIKSKAMWGLGQPESARQMLDRFIEYREKTDSVNPTNGDYLPYE